MKEDDRPFNPATIRSVVEKSIGLLESRCIRLNGRDANWRRLFDKKIDEIAQASSPAEFESRMNAVIGRGGLNHVAFFHQSAQRAPARYAINATFCAFETSDGPRWLFEDVHDGGPRTLLAFVRAMCCYVRTADRLRRLSCRPSRSAPMRRSPSRASIVRRGTSPSSCRRRTLESDMRSRRWRSRRASPHAP